MEKEESPLLLMKAISGDLSTTSNIITATAAKSLTRTADSFFFFVLLI